MTDLIHVTKWCEEYSAKHNIKVFPQSAPLLTIVDELIATIKVQFDVIDKVCGQLHLLEYKINELNEKLTMPKAKVDKKEVKK